MGYLDKKFKETFTAKNDKLFGNSDRVRTTLITGAFVAGAVATGGAMGGIATAAEAQTAIAGGSAAAAAADRATKK